MGAEAPYAATRKISLDVREFAMRSLEQAEATNGRGRIEIGDS